MIMDTYVEYPWGISVVYNPQGEWRTIIIKNIEDEQQDTVLNRHDEDLQ